MMRCHSSTVISATGLEHADAGVVDQDVEAAEVRHGLGERRLDLGVIPNAGRDREHARTRGVGAQLGRGGVEACLVRRGDRHRGALREQRARGGEADPARAAGDERNLASEWTHRPLEYSTES